MRKLWVHPGVALIALCVPFCVAPGANPLATATAQSTPEANVAQPAAAVSKAPAAQTSGATDETPSQRITAYTLPPERYQKAHRIGLIHFGYLLISFVYGLLVLWLILRLRIASRFRQWAENISSRRILQAMIFSPLLILTIGIMGLPTEIFRHRVSMSYGLSIQGWPSWFWDWTKAELFIIVGGSLFIWLLYAVIRKSPRRWWLYFWLVSLPIGLFLVFLTPLILDPAFHKFEPLAQKNPALTNALQNLVQKAGEDIPPERMFWMGAGEKTTTLNAYVTGFGASKRIVVWDTTIARLNTQQIAYVVGHEMGHYVLQHIIKGLTLAAVLLLLAFYLGFRCIGWALNRWGNAWGIRALDDWASLPALLLLLSIMAFAANPIVSGVSRYLEHQADQYGLEVTHGLTPDYDQVAAQAFQALGDVGLADPDPNPVYVFMFYDHPPIRDRVRFSLTYDPWSKGQAPEFVK